MQILIRQKQDTSKTQTRSGDLQQKTQVYCNFQRSQFEEPASGEQHTHEIGNWGICAVMILRYCAIWEVRKLGSWEIGQLRNWEIPISNFPISHLPNFPNCTTSQYPYCTDPPNSQFHACVVLLTLFLQIGKVENCDTLTSFVANLLKISVFCWSPVSNELDSTYQCDFLEI